MTDREIDVEVVDDVNDDRDTKSSKKASEGPDSSIRREAEAREKTSSGMETRNRTETTNETESTNATETDGTKTATETGPTDGPAAVGDELGRLDLRTTPDGYVEATVTDLRSVDETTVALEVTLPHGTTTEFRLEKPIPWSREFLLARIVEDVGYEAASIEYIVGESVYVERIDRLEATEEDSWGWAEWRDGIVRTSGDALLTALGGRFRLEERQTPEWRLVDPLEREPATGEDTEGGRLAALIVVFGALSAVVGGLVAAGVTTIAPTLVAAVLPGLVLVVLGSYWLSQQG
ncbi:hypothetical protein OB919_07785 [Halobacteria archaeon AArc-curdl1]|uniref:Uncharacterized protein n=1 Tax=Natronosalvus hydrolyticus TaxID=2979988 RepID=A0AAP2Z761_9EURY|nr:hypothetical protein [Halobacteria archaeon AArc-curdl1]